jgi:hypothetical protein
MIINMNKTQNRFSGGPVTPSIGEKYQSAGGVGTSNYNSNGITGKKNFEPTTNINSSLDHFYSTSDDNRLESK